MENIVYLHTGPKHIELVESDLAAPLPGYTQIEYLYCGICGSDYSIYIGRRNEYPISLGHEFVARVLHCSNDSGELSQGCLVVSDLNFRCGNCKLCTQGKSHLCEHNDCGLFTNRGFARYANIKTEYLLPIKTPDYLPRACLIEPLSCCIHACSVANIQINDKILINGCGSIGSLICFYLTQCMGYKNVYTFDPIQVRHERLETLFNTIHFLQYQDITFDIIIDCSNSSLGLASTLEIAMPGSRVCVVSHVYGQDSSFVYETICKKELCACFPLRNGGKENLILANTYLQEKWNSKFDSIITVYDDIKKAFEEKAYSPSNKQVVKL